MRKALSITLALVLAASSLLANQGALPFPGPGRAPTGGGTACGAGTAGVSTTTDNSNRNDASAASQSLTFSGALTAGSVILACGGFYDGDNNLTTTATPTCTANCGSGFTFSQVGGGYWDQTTQEERTYCFAANNSGTTTPTIQVAYSNSVPFRDFVIAEVTVANEALWSTPSSAQADSGTTLTSPSRTAACTNSVLVSVGYAAQDTGFVWGSSFTGWAGSNRFGLAYRTGTTASSSYSSSAVNGVGGGATWVISIFEVTPD